MRPLPARFDGATQWTRGCGTLRYAACESPATRDERKTSVPSNRLTSSLTKGRRIMNLLAPKSRRRMIVALAALSLSAGCSQMSPGGSQNYSSHGDVYYLDG